ncbi:hypothetical protein CHUAL_013614 [Chamberlinius hualienensis]
MNVLIVLLINCGFALSMTREKVASSLTKMLNSGEHFSKPFLIIYEKQFENMANIVASENRRDFTAFRVTSQTIQPTIKNCSRLKKKGAIVTLLSNNATISWITAV